MFRWWWAAASATARMWSRPLRLGADAVYIGTGALLALGCHLCRSCHAGKCNWGIATQRPELVQAAQSRMWAAERLVNLVTAWKHEIKEMMGGMGINSIEALQGQPPDAAGRRADGS